MSGKQLRRGCFLFLASLALVVATAHADPVTVRYAVRGPGGTVAWGQGNGMGTEVVLFAFTRLAPEQGNVPPAGPRATFSVTHWVSVGGALVRRQWYGDVPIKPEALVIGAGLTESRLVAEVVGSLEVRSDAGVVIHRNVPGRLEVRWTPSSGLANTTTAFTYQTPPYTAVLGAAGTGRIATTTATITVAALGAGPIRFVAPGNLLDPASGTLVVALL